jgi:hypothetical protein
MTYSVRPGSTVRGHLVRGRAVDDSSLTQLETLEVLGRTQRLCRNPEEVASTASLELLLPEELVECQLRKRHAPGYVLTKLIRLHNDIVLLLRAVKEILEVSLVLAQDTVALVCETEGKASAALTNSHAPRRMTVQWEYAIRGHDLDRLRLKTPVGHNTLPRLNGQTETPMPPVRCACPGET